MLTRVTGSHIHIKEFLHLSFVLGEVHGRHIPHGVEIRVSEKENPWKIGEMDGLFGRIRLLGILSLREDKQTCPLSPPTLRVQDEIRNSVEDSRPCLSIV